LKPTKERLMRDSFSTWYDGALYERFVAPQSDRLQTLLTVFAPKGSTAVDVGCGVGDLAFKLAAKCESVVGVDLSAKMISHARTRRTERGVANVEFACINVLEVAAMYPIGFDVSTMVLFLHEIDEGTRSEAVKQLLSISKTLVIADFAAPFPRSIEARRLKAQEFMAGRRHFTNFKNWMRNGGIDGFLESMRLEARKTITWENRAGKIVVLKPDQR
jgi:SAM-dependent methyltransferase